MHAYLQVMRMLLVVRFMRKLCANYISASWRSIYAWIIQYVESPNHPDQMIKWTQKKLTTDSPKLPNPASK